MVSVVLFCVQLFWWISHKPSEKYWAISPKAKHKISKKTLRTFQKYAFSAALLFCLVVAKENCFENFLRSLLGTIRVFCSNAESPFGRASFRTLRSVLGLFTSCVWDVLRYRVLIKTALIFSETWSSSFCIVCKCFDDFRTNLPKNIGRYHRKENTNCQKWRWVRSKNVCWSSALLFSLVVTKEYVLRTSWGLSTWNNTCFLFKCRVTFRLGHISKARFGTLALYILRLRCLLISKTYKNRSCFLSKTDTFQSDVEYVPKMSFCALVGLLLWL